MSNNYGFDSNKNIYPYNFVSLEDSCDRSNRKKGNLTGYIDISVTPKTDLIVPFEKENEKKYNFFEYNNNYVIPGSQMRGVVRNSYEALTNSCLSQMDDKVDVTYRYSQFDGLKWTAKIIEYDDITNNWKMFSTMAIKLYYDKKSYKYKDSKELKKHFNEINFYIKGAFKREILNPSSIDQFIDEKNGEIHTYDRKNRKVNIYEAKKYHLPNGIKAENFVSINGTYLRFGESTLNDDFSIKLYKKDLSRNGMIIDVDNLKKNCLKYIENIGNLNKKSDKNENIYEDIVNAIKNHKIFIAYYNEAKDYLSPSHIGRVMVKDKLAIMYAGYENCTDQLCPACALFGTISKNQSLASRIRFTDLLLSKNGINTKDYDLVSLGSHLSNHRFYAIKEWNENGARIRGRKYYWHHLINYKTTNEKNKNIECAYEALRFDVNNNKKFEGRIYFEDLTDKELKDLVFSIELGGNNHMLKLGHGKPFGFGSILCKCEGIYQREIKDNKIIENKYVLNRNTWNNYPNCRELELITKFDILKDKWYDIKYPSDVRWFGDRNNIKLKLARITDVVKGKYFIGGK